MDKRPPRGDDNQWPEPVSAGVYEGLWQNYNEPPFRRWMWTLTNSKALVVLAFFKILVTYTQTCSWALLRRAILRWKRPIRLQDESISEPLELLTQGTAIREAIIISKKNIRRYADSLFWPSPGVGDPLVEESLVSTWFGFFALINIALFFSTGILAP